MRKEYCIEKHALEYEYQVACDLGYAWRFTKGIVFKIGVITHSNHIYIFSCEFLVPKTTKFGKTLQQVTYSFDSSPLKAYTLWELLARTVKGLSISRVSLNIRSFFSVRRARGLLTR